MADSKYSAPPPHSGLERNPTYYFSHCVDLPDTEVGAFIGTSNPEIARANIVVCMHVDKCADSGALDLEFTSRVEINGEAQEGFFKESVIKDIKPDLERRFNEWERNK